MDYLDFDLQVEAEPTPDTYKVSVLASPKGEASGQMTFPFNADALENVILKLGRTRSGIRAIGSSTQDVAQKFGSALYEAVFGGEVGTCFRRSLDAADAAGKGLRIRLRLEDAPQLADVPWEYLYPSGLRQFLVLQTRTPVVRYLELPQPVAPLQVTPPLQVLVVVCSPAQLATLNVDGEVQRITTALAGLEQAGQVHVTVIPRATLMAVRRALRAGEFHVLHFIGHGGFDDAKAEGMLAFEDDNHQLTMVSGTTLATTISGFESLRLVVLNACEGARQSPQDPLGGVAQSLVKLGNVPAVVAMQFEITDEAATVFSSEFYAAMADGYPIDAALAEARVAVFSDNNDVEWGTPVLYLRASDGRIFDVAGGGRHTPVAQQPASSGSAPAAPAEGGGVKVVPVIVPPWPGGDGTASMRQQAPAGAPQQSGPPGQPSSGGFGGPPGGGSGGGFESGGGAAADHDGGHDGAAGQQQYQPPGGSSGKGVTWVILAAVAAVVALAIVLWPMVFPGSNTASPSPSPTDSIGLSPTPTVPTTPSPSVSTRTLPPVRDVGTLRALQVPPNSSITVDGITPDWQWQLVANANHQITDTASTATAEVYLMWDEAALYLLAKVHDKTLLEPDPNQPLKAWRGNAVVLELGPESSRLKDSDTVRPQDAYYIFGLSPAGQPPVTAILGPNARRTDFNVLRPTRGVQAAIGRDNDGWILEARIPWSVTGLNGVANGAMFAANVNVAERQQAGFANLGMMSTNAQRTLQVRMHPRYWQGLRLER